MGFFSEDLASMVELYQRETAEFMEEFDARLTAAVQENHFSEQDINAVFRAVHTIKSSAAMMGLSDISTCSHKMEDLFLLFREQPGTADGKEDRIFDLMYAFSDFLKKENARVLQEDFRPESAASLIEAISREIAFFSEEENPAAQKASSSAEKEPQQKTETAGEKAAVPAAGEIVWNLRLRKNCQMENVRAFMLVRQIQPFCEKIKTVPSNLEARESAMQIAESGLLLVLQTAHPDEAMRLLTSSPYVEEVHAVGEKDDRKQTAAETPAKKAEEAAGKNDRKKFSMVSWEHVMQLQNVTGELITANTILEAAMQKRGTDGRLDSELQTMNRLLQELDKLTSAVSMMPVSAAMPQYYRLIRDIAVKENKKVRLKVIGEDLEIDRNLLDTLANPLVHLLRNAADHGIEMPTDRSAAGKEICGTVTLKFENLTDHLRVTVADDGAGMNTDKILKKAAERNLLVKEADNYSTEEILNLAFLPGMTTNEQVSQYSGRGVGMDVAQSVVSNLGGSVTISSTPGKGTSVMMEMPVSMTSAECIRIRAGRYICLVPIRSIVRIFSYAEAAGHVLANDGRRWLQTEEEMLPVIDLFALFGEPEGEDRRLIIIKGAADKAVLLTGPVTGQQIAVEKSLPPMLGRKYREKTGIIGCTVTETGGLGMMLNAEWLIKKTEKGVQKNENRQHG